MIKMSVSILFGAIALFGFLDSTQSVCVLKDAPNQCGSFCIAALRPIMDHNVKTRDQWNYQGIALNETLERLNRIEAQQFEIKSHFESKFLGSLSEKLDKLENKLQTVLLAIESKQQTVQDNAENQRVNLQEEPSKITLKKDFSMYEQIGTRLLYIEKSKVLNYTNAENACREMGGHLATFHNEQEISDIKGKLKDPYVYFLGINDLEKRGEYVSLDSGKKQTFFDWGIYNIKRDNERCVGLFNYKMYNDLCSKKWFFICQADCI